jgi:hypothetical protein
MVSGGIMKSQITSVGIFWALLSFSSISMGRSYPPLYWSPGATQAQMTFEGEVLLSQTYEPEKDRVARQIENQLAYLFGAMTNNSRVGVPKGQHEYEVLRVNKVSEGLFQISYSYHGVVLIESGSHQYSFYLPLNPQTIYTNSLALEGGTMKYPCGDSQHSEEEYYWYFFNPTASGCPLKLNADYTLYNAKIEALPNTQRTYPEYERLIDQNEIRIDILIGMNESNQDPNPLKSKDLSAVSFRQIRDHLLQMGYQSKAWGSNEITKVTGHILNYNSYVEELTLAGMISSLRVRMYFGPSDIYYGETFHHFYKDALEKASLVIYAGHSGLGDYLDIGQIHARSGIDFHVPTDRYQIYFFNGCSSYPYYNQEYFSLKKSPTDPHGTKNLDIITNGLATLFSAVTPSTLTILVRRQPKSYRS